MSASTDIESLEYANSLDKQDSLRHLRDEFIIPSKADLKRTTTEQPGKLSYFKLLSEY